MSTQPDHSRPERQRFDEAPLVLPCRPPPGETCTLRALAVWPRLDRVRLARAQDDPNRIARVVERRTTLPFESILALLTHGTGIAIVPQSRSVRGGAR